MSEVMAGTGISLRISDGVRNAVVTYDSHVLVGEVIRNCCVELGLTPTTVDGVTTNVQVLKTSGDGKIRGEKLDVNVATARATLALANFRNGDALIFNAT